jgi:uncharacterized protein (TIGR02996 family)
MSDREALLAAIKAKPDEDTPRLMFADYLDEFGECKRDRATAEFIRITCQMATKPKMASVRAGNWLDGYPDGFKAADGKRRPKPDQSYVHRLCPTLAAWVNGRQYSREPQGTYPYVRHTREGRWVELRHHKNRNFLPEITKIEFWRGFVRRVEFRHWAEAEEILPLILADQPLCEPEIRGAFGNSFRVSKERVYIYNTQIGPATEAHLMNLKRPFWPDVVRVVRPAQPAVPAYNMLAEGEIRSLRWDNLANSHTAQWRARWAICMALRAMAQEKLDERARLLAATAAGIRASGLVPCELVESAWPSTPEPSQEEEDRP